MFKSGSSWLFKNRSSYPPQKNGANLSHQKEGKKKQVNLFRDDNSGRSGPFKFGSHKQIAD